MNTSKEQVRTPDEDRQGQESNLLALAASSFVVIPCYLAAGCVADVIQQTKHLYYHLRGIPHQFNEDISTHNWLDYTYERLDGPHAINPREDEHFIMKIGRPPKHAFSE